MNILGLHDGHLATAALIVDGTIVAMVSEERLTRRKNQGGAPKEAIGCVLRQAGLRGEQIDAVALATLTQPLQTWTDDMDHHRRQLFRVANRLLPVRLIGSPALVAPYIALYKRKRDWTGLDRALASHGIRPRLYVRHRYEHHLCHAATAYYLSWFRDAEPMLIITADGSGDGLCASVQIGRHGRLERLHAIPSYHSLGELYTRVTELLGMMPLEHEYKVMGLAPYAPPELADRAFQVFSRYYRLTADETSVENTAGVWGIDLRDRLARDLRGVRFDAVAAGVQRLIETIVTRFVLAWVRRTGVRTVAVAGGLFMNVKLNLLLGELPEIERLFLMPSGGDESIALGAALLAWSDACLAAGREPPLTPLDQLYLGPEYSREEILDDLQGRRDEVGWCEPPDIEAEVARLLAGGEILGRLAGRMEWGARSLGNRAILADPRSLNVVRRLNVAIKMRDFWMPFAPSILEERRDDYLQHGTRVRAPYMISAFRSTERAQREIVAGLHPYDLSCRPQIVTRAANPRYHRLIQHFETLTGVGAVLNTSFNLHGEPIVCRPADALHTLLNSELDAVAIEGFLVRRRSPCH